MDKESVVAVPSESAESPYELLDDRFRACQGDKRLQRLFSEGRWLEGPAYFPAGRYLVCSDVPNDRILRWDEMSGRLAYFVGTLTMQMATPLTAMVDSLRVSKVLAASRAPSTTARSP